ncbi:MAG TPA: HAMP domain-containing protein, partial [Arenicellales bacterium]|nr:HAMP domain-containing protein [Arenicellales bacterium]
GEASRVLMLDGRPVQVIIMPFLAPDFEAWMVFGFPIAAGFLQELETITRTGITLVGANGRTFTASDNGAPGEPGPAGTDVAAEAGPRERNGRLVQTVTLSRQPPVYALLGSSMEESMAINERLNSRLVVILLASLGVSALLVPLLTYRVSRPVRALVNAVRSVLAGRYDTELELHRGDEFGELSTAFQHMTRMIRLRERARGVASHIAAPEVAALLLQPDQSRIEQPRKMVCLLSDAFQEAATVDGDVTARAGEPAMDELVRRHHGVMARNGRLRVAVFAGIGLGEGIARALAVVADATAADSRNGKVDRASFSLAAGDALLEEVTDEGPPVVTGHVAALAQQLLLRNADFGARCVADGRIRAWVPELAYRELDTVTLAGEREPLALIEPVGFERDIDAASRARIDRFQAALAALRNGDPEQAVAGFEALLRDDPSDRVCASWLARVCGSPAVEAVVHAGGR